VAGSIKGTAASNRIKYCRASKEEIPSEKDLNLRVNNVTMTRGGFQDFWNGGCNF
jgi:hypothetical protein